MSNIRHELDEITKIGNGLQALSGQAAEANLQLRQQMVEGQQAWGTDEYGAVFSGLYVQTATTVLDAVLSRDALIGYLSANLASTVRDHAETEESAAQASSGVVEA